MGMNCAGDPFNMGMFYYSRFHSKWVCFQIPNTHIRASLYWSRPPGTGPVPALRLVNGTISVPKFAEIGASEGKIRMSAILEKKRVIFWQKIREYQKKGVLFIPLYYHNNYWSVGRKSSESVILAFYKRVLIEF